eukprot:comp22232_c0_seq1/m.32782 comp22232_c0_seq1/g.32782  ORF comp22232_c0_seq1/g.32782 comp22232_c0_seq1/m.32782 type:complete len:328 (-) comp22232_c0_seq1:305-1288(-)
MAQQQHQRTLEGQFQHAERLFLALDNSKEPPASDTYQESVHEAIKEFNIVGELIRENCVFSPNETLKDINTQELRYLLAPAYLGQLVLMLSDQDRKLLNLDVAEEYLKIFLNQCKKLQILNNEDDLTLQAAEPTDPNEKRMLKIARFKRDKAAKAKLQEISQRLAKAATLDTSHDDGMERDHVLALLDTWIIRSCDSLGLLRQERDMLAKVAELKDAHGGKLPPAPPRKPGFKNFTITKEMVKVFGRGYPSPYTYTVEQAACREHDLGLHNHSHSDHSKTAEGEDHSAEDDTTAGYEAGEAKTYKDRKWDAHKDDNPFGWGNRYNKS